jgi:capsule polysaccharide export protein KpsC/LpsZ
MVAGENATDSIEEPSINCPFFQTKRFVSKDLKAALALIECLKVSNFSKFNCSNQFKMYVTGRRTTVSWLTQEMIGKFFC